ncbi:hypothetical protein SDRG_00386 [Saprolegnia diclina VS20]|uniref:Uncharacterized protein n=1 Tax=Saprolegnia diclina (strain VS20) TaxID=1156394 RepID=T0SB78_SAPDV|nr:hypothetical protein SDRG_00386 [Saprolegnia diclina VS20]EQC42658.1 hypothetical protein SDRG_00386 [Saprolegnia diclina VS20]|eukprot:XP_008604081.1 hypothetical protein SDRG_00386 [Saprolegnia diclina VS20]
MGAINQERLSESTCRKRLRELVKETQRDLPEAPSAIEVLDLSDCHLTDHYAGHIHAVIELNAKVLQSIDLSFNDFASGLVEAFDNYPELPSLTKLNLSSNAINDTAADHVSKLVSRCPKLTSIDLSLNRLGKGCARAIVQAKLLVSLDLSSSHLSDAGCDVLCQSLLVRKSSLQVLSLAMNQLTDSSALAVANVLVNDTTCALRTLVLSGNLIQDHGASAIAFSMDRNASIQEIFLDANQIGNEGLRSFLNILRSSPTRTYAALCLDGNPADAGLLRDVDHQRQASMLLSQLPKDLGVRDRLELSGPTVSTYLGSVIFDHMCQACVDILRSYRHLVHVDLSKNAIGDHGAFDIALYVAMNPKLTTLHLGCNQIEDAGAVGLAQALLVNSTLTSLHIESNRLGDAGVRSLYAASFDNKRSALTTIRVDANLHGVEGNHAITAIAEAKKLAISLAQETPLVLDLSGQYLQRFGANVVRDTLSSQCQVLNLCRNALGDDGAAAIATLLLRHTALTKVDLSCNNIGDKGALALAEVLPKNKTLIALNVRAAYGEAASWRDAHISEAGMLALSRALSDNTGLQVVDLRDHCASKHVVASWVQLLQKNATLTKLNGLTPTVFLSRYHI